MVSKPRNGSSDATLPSLALRDADTQRSVSAYFAFGVVAFVGVAAIAVLRGPTSLWMVLIAAAALTGTFCLWLAWSRRREGVFSDREAATVSLMMCSLAVLAMAYTGPVTSPAVILVALLIGQAMGNPARSRRAAWVILLGYTVVGGLALAGVLPTISPVLLSGKLGIAVVIVFVQAVLLASYYYGLSARRTYSEALEHVQSARLALATRQALLFEAFQDLRRLEGGVGRLSGAQIGRYRIDKLLGRGGTGEVYCAKDLESGMLVAVKVLHANLVLDDTMVQRFFREADISSALDSPNIVKVIDHGVSSDGSPFIVMELLSGQPLNQLIREQGPFELQAAERLCRDVASALATAHEAGIVHRDVKPGNVIQTPEGWVLVDFGISKLHTGSGTLTRGDLLGTPGYMSPEQASGGQVDARADVFALGAVLFRVLTGRGPFVGKDMAVKIFRAAHHQPPQPSSIVKMPTDVELVLALAMAKDPNDRLESAPAFMAAFTSAIHGELSETLRERAWEILRRWPWGEEVTISHDAAPRTVAMAE